MKTKIMQFVGTLALIIALTTIGARAADPSGGGGGSSSVLPIGSQDELRNYALSKVVRGSRYVYAKSLDWNYAGSITSTNVVGVGAENVLDKLFAAELKYRLINPDDLIQGYVYLYDKYDNLLFFGYAQFTAEELKMSKPQYNIWIQSVPILENVQSAEILALDEDGQTARHYSVDMDDYGHPKFQPWMSGAPNGILVVRFKDGSMKKYDLANPSGQVPGTTFETAAWKIEGHYVYKKSDGKPTVVKIIETWVRPTVLVTVGTNEVVTFDVLGLVQMNGGITFERPLSMVFEQVDGPWAGAGQMNQNEPGKVQFPAAGTYRVRFEWKNFGQPNTLYTGPENEPVPVGKG